MIAHAQNVRLKTSPSEAETAKSPPEASTDWQASFLQLLPAIRRHACIAFRYLPAEARQEHVQEAIANALVAYARLVKLGKRDLAYAAPLARYAVAQVRSGRRVGSRLNIQDVMSEYCQLKKGVAVESFDQVSNVRQDQRWQEVLIENRRTTPADIAAVRIDIRDWLATLPSRKRRIAETLAVGESTSSTARKFRVSSARISGLRRELHEGWREFQGEVAVA